MLKYALMFWENNGVSGLVFKRIRTIRGGYDELNRVAPSVKPGVSDASLPSSVAEKLNRLLNDPNLTEEQKSKIRYEMSKLICSDKLKGSEDNFRRMLRLAAKYPKYSQFKRKLPLVLGTPPMLGELSRQSIYRGIGSLSAPYTLGAYLGMALPCLLFFSMAEMVVPDQGKLPCKVIKWVGGGPIILCAHAIDQVTAPLETHHYGEPIPSDIQTFMGTLPSEKDFDSLKDLAKSVKSKTESLPETAFRKTYTDFGSLGDLEKISITDVLEDAKQEQAEMFGFQNKGSLGVLDEEPNYVP